MCAIKYIIFLFLFDCVYFVYRMEDSKATTPSSSSSLQGATMNEDANSQQQEQQQQQPSWSLDELKKCAKVLHTETPFTRGVLEANSVQRAQNFIRGNYLIQTIKEQTSKPILQDIGEDDDELARQLGEQLVEHR